MKKTIIITIDGPSSSGKSTISKLIAQHFNYTYIDSGSIYRAITYVAVKHNLIDNFKVDTLAIIEILKNTSISFLFNSKNQNIISVDGVELDNKIRTFKISSLVSLIAEKNEIRQYVVKIQKDISINKSVVMDGRDIGSVVFPDADLKLFLTASPEVRAKRRYNEMVNSGEKVEFHEVLENITYRDNLDSTRKDSPLIIQNDAVVIDNSFLSIEDQLLKISSLIKEKLNN